MAKFLDLTGLTYFYNKLKTLVDGKVSKSGDTMSGTLTFSNGNLNLNHKNGKVYTQDSTGFTYPLVHDNGTNMWIGANATAGQHHTGGIFLSAGVRQNGTPYQSIYVSVPNATNTNASNYEVWHKGNLPQATLNGYALKTEVPTATSDLTNDSGFITSSDIPTIPTATSDLTNDSGFIDNTVDDLANYTDTTTLNTALAGKQDALTVTEYYYDSFTYNKIYDKDGKTVITEVKPYNTVDSNADTPHALKYGRMVNLTGSLKTVGARPDTATWLAGYVPSGCEPRWTVKTRQQGSGQNSYLCEVRTNGGIYISRYGVATNKVVPNNTWLNINMTYISAS